MQRYDKLPTHTTDLQPITRLKRLYIYVILGISVIALLFLMSPNPALEEDLEQSELNSLGEQFRKIKTRFDTIQEKKIVMNKLKEKLGKPGISASDVITVMGPPDELTGEIPSGKPHFSSKLSPLMGPGVAMMPGPVMPSTPHTTTVSDQLKYLIYHLKDPNKFMYFELNNDEKVVHTGWAHRKEE